MKVVILLRSSGGAHFDSIAAIEGYVTACAYNTCMTKQHQSKTDQNTDRNLLFRALNASVSSLLEYYSSVWNPRLLCCGVGRLLLLVLSG